MSRMESDIRADWEDWLQEQHIEGMTLTAVECVCGGITPLPPEDFGDFYCRGCRYQLDMRYPETVSALYRIPVE